MRMTEQSRPIHMTVCSTCGAPHGTQHAPDCPRAQIGTDRAPSVDSAQPVVYAPKAEEREVRP